MIGIALLERSRTLGKDLGHQIRRLSSEKLRVELTDSRVQEIAIHSLDGGRTDVSADIYESRNGKVVRAEHTAGAR